MKKIYLYILAITISVSSFGIMAYAGMAPTLLSKNVFIEVEFKEIGGKKVKLGGLGPYQTQSSSRYVKQSLLVSDGLRGTIRVGEDIPYVEYYKRYLFKHGYVETIVETAFKEVGTKLVVTPKIRGDYIEITLTPQISYLSKGRKDVIDIRELTTSVIVANGQSISIGGLISDEEFSEYFFKTGEKSNLDIILTPRIQ